MATDGDCTKGTSKVESKGNKDSVIKKKIIKINSKCDSKLSTAMNLLMT